MNLSLCTLSFLHDSQVALLSAAHSFSVTMKYFMHDIRLRIQLRRCSFRAVAAHSAMLAPSGSCWIGSVRPKSECPLSLRPFVVSRQIGHDRTSYVNKYFCHHPFDLFSFRFLKHSLHSRTLRYHQC